MAVRTAHLRSLSLGIVLSLAAVAITFFNSVELYAQEAASKISGPLLLHYAGNDARIDAGIPDYENITYADIIKGFYIFSYRDNWAKAYKKYKNDDRCSGPVTHKIGHPKGNEVFGAYYPDGFPDEGWFGLYEAAKVECRNGKIAVTTGAARPAITSGDTLISSSLVPAVAAAAVLRLRLTTTLGLARLMTVGSGSLTELRCRQSSKM